MKNKMSRGIRFFLSVISAFLLVPLLTIATHAETETMCSEAAGDCVQIERITPRTQGEIPVPATFSYHLQLKIQLKSTPRGVVEVRFERYVASPRKAGLAAVAPVVRRELSRGREAFLRQRLLVVSAPITITSRQEGERLRVVAILRDAQGREVAHSTSYNNLGGTLKILPNPAAAGTNRIELLHASPEAGSTLKVGGTTDFTVRFYYSVKSAPQGFISLEFGDPAEVRSGMCWWSVVVPVPRGTGIAEVQVPMMFYNFLMGRTMAVGVPFRIAPLGRSTTYLEIKPYQFGKGNP